jgi:hypothetical protein
MAETLTCYRHPDRETGVSCSECGRGLCPDCMRFAPVGIRCPEHAGEAQGPARVVQRVQSSSARNVGWIAKGLVALNVGIYLLQLAQGAPVQANAGSIFFNGALFGPAVADGDWWRLITAAFLHYGPIHLAMNMIALWLFGPALEAALGSARFLLARRERSSRRPTPSRSARPGRSTASSARSSCSSARARTSSAAA